MTPEKVNLETIVNTIHTYSQRVKTDEERYLLHRMTTDLANRIRQQDLPNFNQGDFLRNCGIPADWGKLSAAA